MKAGLFGKGRGWILAPVSGTTIIVCYVAGIVQAWHGDIHAMLLLGIMAEVVTLNRNAYLDREAK